MCTYISHISERERMKGYKELPQVILEAKKAQDLWLAGLGLKKSHHFSLSPKTGGKKIKVPTQVVRQENPVPQSFCSMQIFRSSPV